MTLRSVDVGFVSTDRTLVDFLAAVFELPELEPLAFPQGTVHRLQGPGGLVKVMVPASRPAAPTPADSFYAVAGLRYLTVRVDDLDAVLARAASRGGTIALGPIELRPGARLVVLHDPDGNAIEVIQES